MANWLIAISAIAILLGIGFYLGGYVALKKIANYKRPKFIRRLFGQA